MRPPKHVTQAISTIEKTPYWNDGIKALMERRNEFSSPMAMKLAGINLVPDARKYLEDRIEEAWMFSRIPEVPRNTAGNPLPEVVIGAGLHAAIYAAVRVKNGAPKPIVLEQRAPKDVGGSFAITKSPTFYLNSRNRPGKIGVPGRDEGLNVLPEAPVQPADLSGDEFQRNSDLAFAIRMTLAMCAKVVCFTTVRPGSVTGSYLQTENGARTIWTNRTIWAPGLGSANRPIQYDGKKVMTFGGFMRHMDQERFPLRELDRVAVVGAGDSGKTVIEALTGKGPSSKWSSCGLDYVGKIDWYGLDEENDTRAGWERCNRARYRNLGTLLPDDTRSKSRVTPFARAGEIRYGYEAGFVDGKPYDLVIYATGYSPIPDMDYGELFEYGGRAIARRNYSYPSVYVVGPAANIAAPPLASDAEYQAVQKAPENQTALFRYADRTAAFAMAVGE